MTRTAKVAVRSLSGVGGAIVLLLSGILTLGTSLVAPLGMWGARYMARRRGHEVSRLASWLGAATASAVACAALLVVLAVVSPSGSLQNALKAEGSTTTADSVRLPAWFTRRLPKASEQSRATTDRLMRSRPVTVYVTIMAGGAMCAGLGALSGSAGWLGTVLLAYAFLGPRLARSPVAPLPT